MTEPEEKSRRPEDSDFKQQRLRAWQPLLTPKWVIATFFTVAIVFIPIGVVVTVSSNKIVELRQRYDETCGVPNVASATTCVVTLDVTSDMTGPVYVYYELSNYYQNHRRYVKSRSDEQLRGNLGTGIGNCDPIETSNGKTLVPCGLIANSYFNDTFSAQTCDSTGATCNAITQWSETGIAWSSDRSDKFKYTPLTGDFTDVSADGVQLPRVDNEHFIVWMRTAGLPTFKKLYAKIDTDLTSGQKLKFTVLNAYPVHQFNGEKAIVLSTTSWLGGKNAFLGWAYITVGIICALLGIMFLLKQAVSPRQLGDMRYFSWNTFQGKGEDNLDDSA